MTTEYPPWQVGALLGTASSIGGIVFLAFFAELRLVQAVLFGVLYASGVYLSWSRYYRTRRRVWIYVSVVAAGCPAPIVGYWGFDVLGSTFLFTGLFLLLFAGTDRAFGIVPNGAAPTG